MAQSTGKRQENTTSPAHQTKSKKARSSSSSSSSSHKSKSPSTGAEEQAPVLVCRIDYAATHKHPSVPSIPLDPNLDTLLYPLKRDEFLKDCLRKRAVHSTCVTGQEEVHARSRVTTIRHEMFDLDPESILRETSSDNVFIWLRKKSMVEGQECGSSSSSSSAGAAHDLIQSIEVSDVDTAIALYQMGGHATYCRAPPNVEQNLVASLLRTTGLGCGQYDPSGDSITSWGRGEVETFLSTPGHVTNWHYDFQENFTIQLSGIKRWTLQRGTVQDPVRGCTPHYAAPETVESQLKAAHLLDRKFRFGHPTTGVNAVGPVQSIDVKPGDTFYFPAGMWHKVETIEPGVSINISLMAINYATVVSQAIQHILHTMPHWRRPILHNDGIHDAQADLTLLLQSLPNELSRTLNSQFIIPPILQYAPTFQSNSNEDEFEERMNDQDEQVESNTSAENDDDDDESEDSRSGQAIPSMTDDDEVVVVDPREFHGYPNGWKGPPLTAGVQMTLRRNPWAILHRMDEIRGFYEGRATAVSVDDAAAAAAAAALEDTEEDTDNSPTCHVYVLNVNYAGNETHQSAVRTVFCDSQNNFVDRLFSLLEESSSSSSSSTATPIETVSLAPSEDELAYLKFLLYHGYVILA